MKNKLAYLLLIFLSLGTVFPLFKEGFFSIHDDTQVARVFEMGKELKMGIFPVRWVPDLGYGFGYPIFNFYAPFAYYVGGFLNIIGFEVLQATKIMIVLGVVLAAFTMYLLAQELFGKVGGLVAALFYVYAPYHALDIYVRGDVAEVYAYAFLPLIFYGLWKVALELKFRYVLITACGFAGLIISHNLTAFMATPFISVFTLYLISVARNKFLVFKFLSFALIIGMLISAFYFIPAILEMNQTNIVSQIGGGADFKDHFVCLRQLWNSPWGFGGSAKGCIDGLSFRIGKVHILFSLLSFISIIFFWKKEARKRGVILFFVVSALISVFMTLEVSKTIWSTIPTMAFLQYPWRYLLLISFFTSFLSGSSVLLIKRFNPLRYDKFVYYILVLIIFILVFVNGKLFNPQVIIMKTANDYIDDYTLKWSASKISDEYLPKNFKKPNSYKDVNHKIPDGFVSTSIDQIANVVSLSGIAISIAGIIYYRKKAIK